jgi:hypothetical protein
LQPFGLILRHAGKIEPAPRHRRQNRRRDKGHHQCDQGRKGFGHRPQQSPLANIEATIDKASAPTPTGLMS